MTGLRPCWKVALLALPLWSLAGCQATGGAAAPVGVRAERAFERCPTRQQLAEPTLRVLEGAGDWTQQFAGTDVQLLGSAVPWVDARVLLVAMGTAPTGGHAVALAQRELAVVDGQLDVVARRVAPPADAMVTQALTLPCLLVQVPRAGWQRARLRWVP